MQDYTLPRQPCDNIPEYTSLDYTLCMRRNNAHVPHLVRLPQTIYNLISIDDESKCPLKFWYKYRNLELSNAK